MRRAACGPTSETTTAIRRAALALMLAAQLVAFTVRADSDEYKRLTDAAVEEHALAHYEEARALFARAHALQPSARTFWGMGIAAFEARDYVDAIQLLDQAREDTRKPLTQAQRAKTDSLIERAHAYVVRLPLRVEPASALVTIDGREAERDADGIVTLDAGAHQIVVSAPGYQEVVRSMTWHAGNAPAFEARLELQRTPSATAAPAEPEVAATAAAPTEAPRADSAAHGTFTVLKWVSLGAAVASVGVMGAGLGLRSADVAYYNDESNCPGPDKDASCPGQREDVRKWEAVAIVGGAAAGVFGALSVVFFVLDRRPREQPRRTYACAPAFQLGAACGWRF